jgi:hypothetical protein
MDSKMMNSKNGIETAMVRIISTLAILLVFSAAPAIADINVFGINNITIDPEYSSAVVGPFTAPCPPYPSCPTSNPQVWPQGFPIQNLFGADILTAEGTSDTIFAGLGSGYDNAFFHVTDLQPVTGTLNLTVYGAEDGPGNPSRSFSYFALYSYSGNVYAPDYDLLFAGTPVTNANGFEVVTGSVNLTDVGPYFIYQFGAPDGGPRIYGVETELTPEPSLYGLLALGLGLAVRSGKRSSATATC